MDSSTGNGVDAGEVHLNNHNISSLTPEHPFWPKLFLQENNSLPMVPPFFEHMPALQVLDLSHTSIQSVPPSIFKLCLLEEFILRECLLLMDLPPEIGKLKNLRLFDLEGTELMYLPKEIGKLETLECLRVSLSTYADDYKDRYGIEHIIPRMTISKLTKLKELSISVNPEAEWWEVELLEAIMGDLLVLPDLKTLKLYVPTAKVLQQFIRLERYQVPIYSSLSNFRLTIGNCEQLTSCVPLDVEENFQKLEKCLKYINGEGDTDEIAELIKIARALCLRRHWTVEKLSIFDTRRLKYCLLMECNEMQTLVDREDLYEDGNRATNHGEEAVFGLLQYLDIHFMKKLQTIWRGPIGGKSLSCLRILALHTCPELTSIFIGCLLDNLQSLTELIVEDCPKVNSLVTLEGATPWSRGPFLPNLRRVSLIDLPELVSISSGVCVAPQLHALLIFNCMKLDYLSVMELPRDVKEIKGEIEWWDALKYGKLTWNGVFVQLKRDGALMDQLAEDTNSLQHFHKLQMIPPHPGSSYQVDQNLSKDHHLGCTYVYTELIKDMKHVKQLQVDHNVPSSNETPKMSTHKILNFDNDAQPEYAYSAFRPWEPASQYIERLHNEDTDWDFKDPNHKDASTRKKSGSNNITNCVQLVRGSPQMGFEVPDDGYIWRKYVQKKLLNSKYPRIFFICISQSMHDCRATKTVQRSTDDPSVFKVAYQGKHTCLRILSPIRSSSSTKSTGRTSRTELSTATQSASTVTDSHSELANMPQVLDSKKKKSNSSRSAKWTQVKVGLEKGLDIPPDDGYTWRKYGLRKEVEAKYSCSYYKCTKCMARKQVRRFDDDPSTLEITYIRGHTCFSLSRTRDSSTATESSLTILQNSYSSASTITDNSFEPNCTKMSGNARIQWLKQQANRSFQMQLPSSIITAKQNMTISEVLEDSSSPKTPQNAKPAPLPASSKVKKEKLGDKITALQKLVSPFGKRDTASVLLETCGYIQFLHDQISALVTPYTKQRAPEVQQQQTPSHDLRSRGLCLVPASSMFPITNQITIDFSSPAFGEHTDESE